MPTPILQLPLVAPNQNQKETTINSALAILEAASNDARTINGTGNPASITLGDVNFTRWLMQRVQNHTAAINVVVPALKRFFVVANEGTGPVTFYPTGGTALANGAQVPAGKIVLMMSDGVNVRALSSGVSRLNDLTDVITTPVADGQVLLYVAAEDKWRPATIAEALEVGFVGLSDTPSSYTGQAGKLVRVKSSADGVEFASVGDLNLNFTDLDDAPNSLGGQADKLVAVNPDGTALIFVDAPPMAFADLTDVPPFAGNAGKLPVINETEDGVAFVDVPPVSFLDLTDSPSDYTGQEGKLVVVNATGDGVEFGDAPASTFLALTDAPDDYTGQEGKLVAVKDDGTGLEFVDSVAGSIAVEEGDVEVSDAAITLNFEGAGVDVVNDGAGKVTITVSGAGLSPAEEPHAYWRVRAMSTFTQSRFSVRELEFRATVGGANQTSGGTAIASSSDGAAVAANAFDGTNAEWTSTFGDIGGDGAWIGYQFASPVSVAQVAITAHSNINEALRSGFVEWSDNGADWFPAWRLPIQAAWTSGQQRLFAYVDVDPSFLDLPDTPEDYVNDGLKQVRVKSDETGLEFFTPTFLALNDTPANYTGAAKRKVRVNTAGTAIEFVVDNQAANVVTTKTEAYTAVLADAEERTAVIPVNVSSSVDVTIPPNSAVAYPIGTQLSVIQLGSAQVGVVGGSGVTVSRAASLSNLTREQYSMVMALKIGSDSWILFGDLGPAA